MIRSRRGGVAIDMTISNPTHRTSPGVGLPATALILGLLVALVAQFGLDRFADSSDLGHWMQHGILFAGGILTGAGGLALYRRGQRPA